MPSPAQFILCMEQSKTKEQSEKTIVKVSVEENLHSGLAVKVVETGQLGFIPQRELAWDRRMGRSLPKFKKGKILEAVILPEDHKSDSLYLSLKQVSNPWASARVKYAIGQIVRAEVVNLRHYGAFVQIEPGIVAIIWAKNIPLKPDQIPADILSIGDQVEGEIYFLEPARQKIELSLIARLEALDEAYHSRVDSQYQLFLPDLEKASPPGGPDSSDGVMARDVSKSRYFPPIPTFDKILVIENNQDDQELIRELLQEEYKPNNIDTISSSLQLKALLEQKRTDYSLAIIDIMLDDERGPQVAGLLLEASPGLPIIFVSSDPFALEKNNEGIHKLESKYGRKFPFADKNKSGISEWIDKLVNGYSEDHHLSSKPVFKGQHSFVEQLGMASFYRVPLAEALEKQLHDLCWETKVSHAFLLEVDPVNQKVKILANYPPVTDDLIRYAQDGLYFSPVREVVENGEPFSAGHITPLAEDAKFKNFFPRFPYRSCYGIPFKVPVAEVDYALFVLDDKRDVLSQKVKDKIRLAGHFSGIVIERALILDFMQKYEERYFKGQLLGTLVHELKNTVSSLIGPANKSIALLNDMQDGHPPSPGALQEVIEKVSRIQEIGHNLNGLINAYSRLARKDFEEVDVNNTVGKVKKLLQMKAKEKGVHLTLQLGEDILKLWSIPLHLEQVVLNVMLNAIQQIDEQAATMRESTWPGKDNFQLLQKGIVQVITRRLEKTGAGQIIVIDTGPGITYSQKEKIFNLGSSTRKKGQGLGLYISRNLTEAMGGRLYLLNTVRFVGSAFVIELPTTENK